MIDERYIAGFFDGEGSAMVLTIHRNTKVGKVYRFWPTVKIAQKTDGILDTIKTFLGYGNIRHGPHGERNNLMIRGLTDILAFVNCIGPFVILKHDVLMLVGELAAFQQQHIRNIPYTQEEMVYMVEIRDHVFALNQITRANLKQKYPRDVILQGCAFVDTRKWILKRAEHGARALEEAGKPFRFVKGVRYAQK